MNYYRECVVKAEIEKFRFGQEELRSKLFSKICSNTNTSCQVNKFFKCMTESHFTKGR